MRDWDRVSQGVRLRPGPGGVIVLLAGVLLCLAPIAPRLERTFYDVVVASQTGSASKEVVLIDTRRMRSSAGGVWESDTLPQLLDALRQAQARLVVITEAPPLASAAAQAAELSALEELERVSRATADQPSQFTARLAELHHRAELRERVVAAVARSGRVIISLPAAGDSGATDTVQPGLPCSRFADRHPKSSPAAAETLSRRLCAAVLGSGITPIRPDEDGVVRQVDLVVRSNAELLPSVALTATLAASGAAEQPPSVDADAIAWGGQRIQTTNATGILPRYYAQPEQPGAIETLEVSELLGQPARVGQIADRIVVLGDAPADTGAELSNPAGGSVSPALIVATAVSNLLQTDYLRRPGWTVLTEKLLLLAVAAAALGWAGGRKMGTVAGAGLTAALGMLGVEALLLTADVWVPCATAAIFALCAVLVVRLRQARPSATPAPADATTPSAIGNGPQPAPLPKTKEDEFEVTFATLRHQEPTEYVKERLYEIALQQARQRDLGKAERVLRLLAKLDPGYRNAGEKLKRIGGMHGGGKTPASGSAGLLADNPLPTPPPAVDLSGKTIGRYQIEQPIGRGAMATVYLGRDPQINRRVAIKVIAIAEEFNDGDVAGARTLFRREVETAGRLNHPNIITIYDAGEDGERAYLAMEYFPCKSLSQYGQLGRLLPAWQVMDIVACAADALHYAHRQNVVHRDVKPANLLYDPESGVLKITDFGIARLTDTNRTKTGIVLGSPSYMSPEQIAGNGVDGQSDLFSLGITLYQLLTAILPFRADSIPKLMQKIVHEPHAPVSRLRDDLPPAVDKIIDRALAKNPADRYPDGRAMALALRDCCSSLRALGTVKAS